MNFLLTMSGGTTPVINSTLVGVIKGIKKFYPKSKFYISKPGIVGILNNNIFELKLNKLNNKILKKIKLLPGSSLTGTSRIEKFNNNNLLKFEKILKQLNVSTFINIGGSGTINQTIFLHNNIKNINFIALPKTVDNDLGDPEFKKLIYTPGYLSSAKYLINHIYNLIRENKGAYFNDKVIVSQIFGRDTSFLAATTNLIRSERVITLFPEHPISKEKILYYVKNKINKYGGCIIIVPEGYDETIFNEKFNKEYDESGQIKWGSSHNSIAQVITSYLNNCNIPSRICNTTIEQRQCGAFLDSQDINIAYKIGFDSIKYSKLYKNFFVGLNMNKKIISIPIQLSEIKNFNRKFPIEWIDKSLIKTNKKFEEYFKNLNPGKRLISNINDLSLEKFEKKINI